ncbi:MAG: hypothetical protein CMO30_02265 [Tistrella sp.]|nr:hypothetical protein [Tistrella sp.]
MSWATVFSLLWRLASTRCSLCCGLGWPDLVLVVAVRAQPVADPVGERRQAVAVPLLERVNGQRQTGAPALVGQHGDLVDQMRVHGPAAGMRPETSPGVLAVEPDHDVLAPLPQVVTQLGVQAGCQLQGLRQQRVAAQRLFLFLCAVDGDVELAVGEPDVVAGDGEREDHQCERRPAGLLLGGHRSLLAWSFSSP